MNKNNLRVSKVYDLIIVGSGPAGLTASLYAARYKVNHLVIGDPFSAVICEAHTLENWPGTEKIAGIEFMQKLFQQVKNHNVEIINDKVSKIEKKEKFVIQLNSGQILTARSIIIATGAERKKLAIPGEDKFAGKGVSYCATCDAPFFKGKITAAIGGGNSALMAADLLANYSEKVYLIARGKELRAEPIWQEKAKNNPKIEIIYERNVIEIKGKEKVEEIILNQEWQGQKSLRIGGLIIEVGSEPISGWFKEIGIETDERGYVKIQKDGSTSCPGIFAAGDITDGSNAFRQVVTAAAEGAVAALGVYNYLKAR